METSYLDTERQGKWVTRQGQGAFQEEGATARAQGWQEAGSVPAELKGGQNDWNLMGGRVVEVCACVCTRADRCGRTGVIRGSRERWSCRASQEPVRKELWIPWITCPRATGNWERVLKKGLAWLMSSFEGHPGNSVENDFGEGSLEVSRLNRKLLQSSKAMVPNPEWATESLEGQVKIQMAGLQPQSFWTGGSPVCPEKVHFLRVPPTRCWGLPSRGRTLRTVVWGNVDC